VNYVNFEEREIIFNQNSAVGLSPSLPQMPSIYRRLIYKEIFLQKKSIPHGMLFTLAKAILTIELMMKTTKVAQLKRVQPMFMYT